METRRFGRSGHLSTVAIFGAAGFLDVDQAQADESMRLVIERGINHIDVAPSYGKAEERLGPWLQRERERFFIGCKTMERTRRARRRNWLSTLKLLRIEAFDLYQMHAITSMAELDQVTQPGGALEAAQQARKDGLTRYIGITGHESIVRRFSVKRWSGSDFELGSVSAQLCAVRQPGLSPEQRDYAKIMPGERCRGDGD